MDVLAYFLYNLAIIVASPVIGAYYLLRLWRRGFSLSGAGERLGFLRALPAPEPGGRLWLHAVSVGEVGVAVGRGFQSAARLGVAGFPQIVQRHHRATRADAHAFENPLVGRADIELFEERVGDLVFRMKVSQTV